MSDNRDHDPHVPHFSTARPGDPVYPRHVRVRELMERIATGEIDRAEATRLLDEYDRRMATLRPRRHDRARMSDKRPHHLEQAAREAEAAFLRDTYHRHDRWVALEDFDQHQGGQLRLVVAGEQTHLLPLPDSLIPRTEEP